MSVYSYLINNGLLLINSNDKEKAMNGNYIFSIF